ncbi:MAG TPA: aldo/keto reductase [Rhodospirillaceae bacterium]|nr:aldo/keto reductase [Rhodospirillaceae bacterium]HAA92524.1 aldo/keto reductase [Rhodospirillaceae bacterium]HAT36097.1 aldo/keto reductase [Rhodospirillaceae bacterium]
MTDFNRKEFLKLTTATALGTSLPAMPALSAKKIRTKKIPKTGEELPVIGVGTSRVFDIRDEPDAFPSREEVLRLLFEAGGSVIDSSPMYGSAEGVVGDLLAKMGDRAKAFIATKVWTDGQREGIAEMNESFSLFKTQKIDLMQVHNLVDTRTQLKTMRAWKDEGRFRYLGITHYVPEAIDDVIAVIEREPLDFLQMMYSLDEPEAANRLLPLCQEKGIAFLANRPFARGSLFRMTRGLELPGWAKEFGIDSWARFFLKFVIAHSGVTCAIPGTDKPKYMTDNLGAGYGPLPDAKMQAKMLKFYRSL